MQEEQSYSRLKEKGFKNISVSGDTRYDRVLAQALLDEDVANIEEWKAGNKVLVLGSSWKEEESLIAAYLKENKRDKVIIAPHEIGLANIERIESMFAFTSCSKYSKINKDSQVLIVDSIGLLSKLYKYGDVAIVGGGYGRGLHIILEPLAYGLLVFFGPVHDKFPEAERAIKAGVGFELKSDFKLPDLPSKNEVKKYIQNYAGATDQVLNFIKSKK